MINGSKYIIYVKIARGDRIPLKLDSNEKNWSYFMESKSTTKFQAKQKINYPPNFVHLPRAVGIFFDPKLISGVP